MINRTPKAFTLAETLITLAIIGIVAAMTIPSLVQKYQEKVLITKLKKFYAELSYAHNMSIANENTDFNSDDILKVFKVHKICENTYSGCADNNYTILGGYRADWGKTDGFTPNYVILENGMIIRYFTFSSTVCQTDAGSGALKNVCGEFSIDLNGSQPPNTLGKDVFYFYITQKGVVPFGTKDETRYPFETACNKNSSTSCAAWVLENENFDYTKCDDLSWDGKRSCN